MSDVNSGATYDLPTFSFRMWEHDLDAGEQLTFDYTGPSNPIICTYVSAFVAAFISEGYVVFGTIDTVFAAVIFDSALPVQFGNQTGLWCPIAPGETVFIQNNTSAAIDVTLSGIIQLQQLIEP